MMNAALRGKPDAGNPHVAPTRGYGGTGRFDEGEVAPVKPRRGSLLYKIGRVCVVFACFGAYGLCAEVTWTGLGADNKWSTTKNWSTDRLPSSSDAIAFRGPWAEGCQLVADTESTQRSHAKIVFENPLGATFTVRGSGTSGGVTTGDTFYFGCGVGKTGNAVFDGGTYSIPYYNKIRLASPGGGTARWAITNGALVKVGNLYFGTDATNNVVDVTLSGGDLWSYGADLSGVAGTNTLRVTDGILHAVPWSGNGHARLTLGAKPLGLSRFIVDGGSVVATNKSSTYNSGILAGAASNATGRVEIHGGDVLASSITLAASPFARGEYYQDGGTVVNLGNLTLCNAAEAYKETTALAVFNGGVCSNVLINVGAYRDKRAVGSVIVSNGLVCAGTVYVADRATGLLTVEGGELRVQGDVVQHNNTGADATASEIRLNGGVLTATSVRHLFHSGNPRFSQLCFNGGTLRAAADSESLIGPRDSESVAWVQGVGNTNEYAVVLRENGGTIDTDGYVAVIPKSLTGTGALTKTGEGTLELTGANAYTGGTVVRAGALVVNEAYAPDVTLSGGALHVPRRGKSPSVASLQVVGGELRTSIADGACDALKVKGTATWSEEAVLTVALQLRREDAVRGTFVLMTGLPSAAALERFAVKPVKGYSIGLALSGGVLSATVKPTSGLVLKIR